MSPRSVYVFIGYYVTLSGFGAFSLVSSLVGWLAGVLPESDRTERFFQRLIHRNFALFIAWTSFARLFHVRFHGLERLPRHRRGLVVVANHPGLTDITCLLARIPEAVCIFKSDIRRNPVLGAAARRAGYVPNDGGHDVIRLAAAKVAAGHTLVVFPEGTRTPPGRTLLPLKSGFVLIARRAGVPIQLVHITCTRPVLSKGRAWWKLPPLPGTQDVTFGPLIEVDPQASTVEVVQAVEAWYHAVARAGNSACAAGSEPFCSPVRTGSRPH